ncbi:MAG: hypothetical protein COS07_00750, partial [Candidatus Aenigmarchaeota archaeon CG01_land_8_20_14_3_00_37_9]
MQAISYPNGLKSKCRVLKLFRTSNAIPLMLTQKKIDWIIRWKKNGKQTKEIAIAQKISRRRVQQLYKEYKRTGKIRLWDKINQFASYCAKFPCTISRCLFFLLSFA